MESKINELLQKPIIVINLGLRKFAESLEEQKVEVVQVDWVPPAGGDQEMMDLSQFFSLAWSNLDYNYN